jgi:hypothetical protein
MSIIPTITMKKLQKEGIFGATKKFTDAFFDGLKNNATDTILAKARKARMDKEVIEKLEKIKKEKEELDKILSEIPTAKF